MVSSKVSLALCYKLGKKLNRKYSVFSTLRMELDGNAENEQSTSRSIDPVAYGYRRQSYRKGSTQFKKHIDYHYSPLELDFDKPHPVLEPTDLLTEGTWMLFDQIPRKFETVQPYYLEKINLRVCSYNVLSQSIAGRTIFLYSHLLNSKKRQYEISWPHRSKLLAKEFSLIGADIYCLQEVEHDHYTSFFEPTLSKAGYKSIYKKRTGPLVDGCAIFYRSNLDLLFSKDIEFVFTGNQIFNQGNIAQVARFRMRDGSEFCVTNTHLLFNKRLGQVKIAQASKLLAAVYEATSGDCPYLMCGDFNMQPGSPLYNFISDGFLPFANLRQFEVSGQGESGGSILRPDVFPIDMHNLESCRITKCGENREALMHKMKFASAYSHVTDDYKPEISAFQSEDACNPDFIFYSVEDKILQEKPRGPSILEIREGPLHLVRRLSLPSEMVLRRTIGPWPNFTTPSDHIPLVVDFALQAPSED